MADSNSFSSLRNSSKCSRKQIFKDIFLFYHEIECCVYSLESPHRGDSNVHSTFQYCIGDQKDFSKL